MIFIRLSVPHGHTGPMGMFFHDRGGPPPERPADPAVRRANLRRIGPLFKPYRRRLSFLLGLIVASAALGVLPAFLLRRVLEAIVRHDTGAISFNAGGMIVIAVVSGMLGVIQTLLSNQVGQRVMHDLRASVFRHLQRLSLAFFTRTRTGEVQSRISNDIGGVQNVVTNTATNIASSVTTVVATMVGMLLLSWELALFAFALIPLFAVLTRRVSTTKSGSRASAKSDSSQLRRSMPTSVAATVVTLCAIEVAVFVTTFWTPPMSFEIRDCTSPVRVRVKNASESRCRWR